VKPMCGGGGPNACFFNPPQSWCFVGWDGVGPGVQTREKRGPGRGNRNQKVAPRSKKDGTSCVKSGGEISFTVQTTTKTPKQWGGLVWGGGPDQKGVVPQKTQKTGKKGWVRPGGGRKKKKK